MTIKHLLKRQNKLNSKDCFKQKLLNCTVTWHNTRQLTSVAGYFLASYKLRCERDRTAQFVWFNIVYTPTICKLQSLNNIKSQLHKLQIIRVKTSSQQLDTLTWAQTCSLISPGLDKINNYA